MKKMLLLSCLLVGFFMANAQIKKYAIYEGQRFDFTISKNKVEVKTLGQKLTNPKKVIINGETYIKVTRGSYAYYFYDGGFLASLKHAPIDAKYTEGDLKSKDVLLYLRKI